MSSTAFFHPEALTEQTRSNPIGPYENQAHLRYRPDIDGLRAVAVLPVVFYHAALGFSGGFVGVDVFFVISGFLITKIIYDLVIAGKFSFVEFYDRRVRRLFPALFVMFLLVTAWSVIHLISPDLLAYGASLAAATAYLSNVDFYHGTGYFITQARTQPLLHTWSLAVEEQFYIVVPFVLFVLVRYVPRRFHVPAIVAISVLSWCLCVWVTRIDTSAAFYLLPMRAWELGLGGVLAISAPAILRRRPVAEVVSLVGMAMILFSIFDFSGATPFPGWHATIPTVGTAAVLSTGGRSGATVERVLSMKMFTFIGEISYSLYLWHWPVIVAFTYAAPSPPTPATSLLAIAISLVLATLSWQFVEKPFRKRRLLGDARSLFIAAVCASALTIACGAGLYLSKGLPQRQPRAVLALLDDSRWTTVHNECHRETKQRLQENRLCVRGAPGVAPSFVLAGDSHADALSEGLFEAARRHGVAGVQITAPGFVPLPGRHSLTSEVSKGLAGPFMVYLRANPSLKTIIITGFWVQEATGQSYRNPSQMVFVDAQYDGSGAAYDPKALHNGLARLVSAFPARHFILLDDVPTGDQLSLSEYARLITSGVRVPQPGLARADADKQRATYEPILRAVAKEHKNVSYEPVLARLCGPQICPLFRPDGIPIIRDGDHLSRYGSADLASSLEVLFGGRRPTPLQFKQASATGITAR